MTLTGTVFLCAYFAGLGFALFRQPIYGLFTYLAVFYLHPPSRWWGESLPDIRWSFVAAIVTILAIWLRAPQQPGRQSWLATTPAKLMIAFTVWFWIVSFWALDPTLHYPAAVLITKYVLVFFMVYRLIDTPAKVNAFFLVHVAGCLYLGWLGYLAGAPGGRLDGVGGPGIDDSNTLGMQLATGVVVAGTLMLRSTGWRLILCFLSVTFSLNALVLTGTRGGFLALVAAGVTLAYLKPRAVRGKFYIYATAGVMLLGVVGSQYFWERMATTETALLGQKEQTDTSAYSRIAMFKAQIEMAKLYPFGTGQRGSEVLSSRFLDKEFLTAEGSRSSHNAFMTVLVEQGIPGAVMFLLMVGWTALTLRKVPRYSSSPYQIDRAVYGAAVGGALTVVLVGGLFADFSKAEVQIWMLALLAGLTQPQTAPVGQAAVTEEVPASGGYRVVARPDHSS